MRTASGPWGATLLAVALAAAACAGGSADDSDLAPTEASASTSGPDEPSPSSPTDDPSTTIAPEPTPPTTEPPLPEVTITVAGDEEVVFDHSDTNCNGVARPDLPVRAFRTGEQVALTLAHTQNHRLVGADFDTLALSCDTILASTYDHDPAGHAHHEWLAATWTADGTVVHGVVHNEFHGYSAELADSRRALLDGEDPGDWQYFARAGDATTPMTPAEQGVTGGGLCTIDFWGAHPDLGCDAVSRWTSDRDGQLVIDVDATKVGVGGDGVTVDVRIDGTVVWQAPLTDDDASAMVRLTEEVAVGSNVDVGVAAGADSSFDATELRTVITPDGERCTADERTCTRVELTAVRSDDGGATFTATAQPPVLVASPPGRYEHDTGFSATWQPTNIVAHPDGGHVMIVQYDDARTNEQYSCLLRTDDIADPSAWRSWDGESFSLPAIDPYVDEDLAAACARIGPAPISGLAWHAESELFLAVGGFAQFGRNGQYALVSRDLVDWSSPIFIQPAEFVFTSDTPPFEPYATLIDHTSTSPNFDTVGDTPHLYFTRINDPETLDFDLVRVPLAITLA